MKLKRILASILCIAMVLSTMGFTVFADATIHNVTNDTELASAISSAVDGDTIKLAAGTYTGGISIGKNITLEGSVDADGSPTTVFSGNNDASGGYYDYSIYMNKGIIKNIKIIEAWKGIMTESIGSLTIDNVTMVNIMYGIHIAEAKNAEDTVLIQNSNIDIAWANSFAGGEYAIVMKNNVLTAENPYYGSGYGANLVNTFAPNTNIEDNVFGENAKILIRDEAKEEAVIGTNYYAEGFENALSDDCAHGVVIETYYKDKEMTETVQAPTGVLQTGAVNAADANRTFITVEFSKVYATESLKLEILDENDTLLATTTATQKVFDEITFPIGALSSFTGINCTDEYWSTIWEENKLRGDYVPQKTVLYVDGVKLSEGTISDQLTGEITPLDWGTIPGVAPAPVGTITPGYTSETRIWGEGTATANYSYIVELYAGDEKIAQAKLKDYNNVIDGDVYVTWGIPFDGSDSDYWDVEWYGKNPYVDTVPTKVVLVADDKIVAENIVKLCAPDDLNPVLWDELENVPAAAKLGNKRFGTIQEAVNAATTGDNEIIILPGTYDESFMVNQVEGLNITIKAENKGDVTLKGTISVNGNRRQDGAETLTIENIVFDGREKTAAHDFIIDSNGTPNYPTYAHNVTIKNCEFLGNNDYNNAVVAFRERKAGSNNIVFDGCAAKGLHSLIQVSNSKKITVTNCEVTDCESVVNATGSAVVVFTNNTVDVDNFAVRTGQSSASTNTAADITMTDNTITADVTALAMRNATTTAIMTNNSIVAPVAYTAENSDSSTINGVAITADNIVEEITNNNTVTKPSKPIYGGGGSSVTKYTLTFDTNGGSNITKVSKAKNTTVDLTKYTTSKYGYSFDGWYSDKELTNKVTSVKLTGDMTVYAKWTKVDDEQEDGGKTDSAGWKNPFADVSAADWYYENVRYAAENKLMNGTSENTFSPNNTLTRAMLVTVLYRLEGEPVTNKSIPFGDVDMGEYYGNAVSWAKQNGIVSGITETEFAPTQNISREQIAAIIYRYAQYKGYDVSLGDDVEIANYDDFGEVSQYAISAMKYGVASGLLKGRSDRTLNPKDNATRAEIAAILQRFAETYKN